MTDLRHYMNAIQTLVEASDSNSSIDKFWVNTISPTIVTCDEHADEEGIGEVPENALSHGWVRGGLSSYSDCYHLEATTIEQLRIACRILLRDYSKDVSGLHYDISAAILNHGTLDRKQLMQFVRTGQLP